MLSVRSVLVLLTLTFLWAPTANAQLDLPDAPSKPAKPAKTGEAKPRAVKQPKKRKRQSGNMVKHLVCTVCYERNYTASLTSLGKDGLSNVYCKICRRPTFHKSSKARAGGGDLDLPSGGVVPLAGTGAKAEAQMPRVEAPAERSSQAADFILAQVRNTRDLKDSLALRAVDSLVALGDAGFAAARLAIADDEPSVCMCAARVLLKSSLAADRDRVVQRLRGRLPSRVGPLLLVEVVAADPVIGAPSLLADLLDHPHTAVRNTAYRELQKVMKPELLDDIARALESKRASTRVQAVELLGRLDESLTLELLIKHLGDPSARVADGVAGLVALSRDEDMDARLLKLALDPRWILRESSYALLAIVEREDANLTAILQPEHVQRLLEGLDSSDPFVSGTCATALAGIGFRSADVMASEWLERKVPDRMVAAISGRVFHSDFASLQPHVLRRLRLITGKPFGGDGQIWVQWWVAERSDFYPHRAHLFVDPERVGTLEVHYRSLGSTVDAFNLIGEDLAEEAHHKPLRSGEQIFLNAAECRDLISILRTEGVLGSDRLPGTLTARGLGQRTLEVLIDGHGKKFMVGKDQVEPWFERITGALQAMRERSAWQRFPDPTKYADSYALWKADKHWWAENHTEAERAVRAKSQLMGWLASTRVTGRMPGIEALEKLTAIEGVAEPEDYGFLRDRLREERFFGPRANKLLVMTLAAARRVSGNGLVSEELGVELANVVSETFGASAAPEIALVIKAGGSAHVRQISEHKHPLMRAIAATVLAESNDQEDLDRLLEMLNDESQDVQVAAMLALGQQKIEGARTELLVRARYSDRPVRVAALRSVAYLGGEFVYDSLLAGRSDPDPFVREASVEGLAILGDSRAAPLLISLLAKGKESATYDLAWNGLLRMGEDAHADLLHAMYSPTNHARRQATFLLARQLESQATSTLISLLTDAPGDRELLREVAILTCVDYSAQPDSTIRWWDWWDEVVHEDSLAWFRAALERENLAPPVPECFRADGTLEGALFLVSVLENQAPHLAERARRELVLMLDHELPEIPRDRVERVDWIAALRQAVLAQWEL